MNQVTIERISTTILHTKQSKSKIKVAVAEDHEVFRTHFIHFLKSANDFEVVIEAGNGAVLIAELDNAVPDIIILDIRMPILDGFAVARLVRLKYPFIKILVLTQFDNDRNIIEMFKIGVSSFLSKNQLEEVPRVLEIINNGGSYYPDDVTKVLQSYLALHWIPEQLSSNCPHYLTEEDKTIIKATGAGMSSTEISQIINKSHRTVEKYREALYRKFNVNSKEQFILLATKWGIIS